MALINRATKTSSGTTDFVAGTSAVGDEVDADVNLVVNEINGNIVDVNIGSSADIDPSKVGDYSATGAESRTEASPGTSAAPSNATTMESELSRLRYAISRASFGVEAQYLESDNTTYTQAAWQEAPVVGPNLLRNGAFSHTVATGDPPLYWTELDELDSSSQQLTDITEGTGYELSFVALNAAEAGITQTVDGLKESTRYLVGARVKQVTAAAHLSVTGGLGAGSHYQNFDLSTTETDYTTLAGIVETTGTTVGDIVVRLHTNGAASDAIDVGSVWMYELSDTKQQSSAPEVSVVEVAVAQTVTTPGASWYAVTSLEIDVIPWRHNNQVRIDVQLAVNGNLDGFESGLGVRLKANTSTVYTTYIAVSGGLFTYVNPEPVAGTLLAYTVEVYRSTRDYVLQPSVTGILQTSSAIIATVT
jgi:hypothetical protein